VAAGLEPAPKPTIGFGRFTVFWRKQRPSRFATTTRAISRDAGAELVAKLLAEPGNHQGS
jgi:hypothetical protein